MMTREEIKAEALRIGAETGKTTALVIDGDMQHRCVWGVTETLTGEKVNLGNQMIVGSCKITYHDLQIRQIDNKAEHPAEADARKVASKISRRATADGLSLEIITAIIYGTMYDTWMTGEHVRQAAIEISQLDLQECSEITQTLLRHCR